MRLKLYLSMVMMATKAPHVLRPYPASAWASMLDLPEPEGQGARRVNDAQRWLKKSGFILREENGSHAPTIAIADIPQVGQWGSRYITLELDLWQNGWIHSLSGRALTMYVVLRELTGGRAVGSTASGDRKREYGLSDETWAKGCADLELAGIAKVTSVIDKPDRFSRSQPRNKYVLVPGALSSLPPAYQS
jgi:hypothetical protein